MEENYLKFLIENYPIRRKKEDKEKFANYIINESKSLGYDAKVETLDNKHDNIIIGDVDKAKFVFSAHYDTPAASIFPNLMIPRNKVISICYQLSYPLFMALLALLISYFLAFNLLKVEDLWGFLYVVLYFSMFYFSSRFFDNRNNANDNTSGVATILSLLSKNKGNNNFACILFDNEEKGKLGSKAYSLKHNNFDKLLINFDCVGNGDNIIVIAKDKAKSLKEYLDLQKYLVKNDNFNVKYYPLKGSISNSDYKNFECGVSVMACKKNKFVGYYTPSIHTKFDTIVSNENIEFISDCIANFIKSFNR